MLHAAIHAVPGTLVFRTMLEGRALWLRLAASVRLAALVLMPTHIHLLLPGREELSRLAVALRGYALWRNRARNESGPVWDHRSVPTPVGDREKQRRVVRYIHLNPCREGLAADPLAWPFSTHRDMLGLALPPVVRPVRDAARLHAFVSGDPSVCVAGTPLPTGSIDPGPVPLDGVIAAVSALARTPAELLHVRGPARDLLVSAAREFSAASADAIADMLGISASTVRRTTPSSAQDLLLVRRVIGDARFPLLGPGDLPDSPAWRPYRHLR